MNNQATDVITDKPKRQLTEAQRLAFLKGREKRMMNIEMRRQEKLEAESNAEAVPIPEQVSDGDQAVTQEPSPTPPAPQKQKRPGKKAAKLAVAIPAVTAVSASPPPPLAVNEEDGSPSTTGPDEMDSVDDEADHLEKSADYIAQYVYRRLRTLSEQEINEQRKRDQAVVAARAPKVKKPRPQEEEEEEAAVAPAVAKHSTKPVSRAPFTTFSWA